MLKSFEASGKSVDEAIDKACLLAGRTIEDLDIEILDLGGKGFLGFGSRDSRVRVSYEQPDEPAQPLAQESAKPVASTFGVKMSKKERFEQKNAKAKAEIEIKPIVTVDPAAGLPEELKQSQGQRQQPRPKRENNENRESRENRERRERRERPGRPERSDRPERNDKAERPVANRSEIRQPKKEARATDVTPGEMEQQLTEAAMAFLRPVFQRLGAEPQILSEVREGILWLCFSGESLGILIGRRGETLNSLQYLCNLAVNKHRNDHVRLVLDVEQYRQGREETLSVLAHKMADKAVKTGRRVELEPMNPHERRVVHIALQNDRRVDTISHGEEPYRRVVISKRRYDNKKGPRKEGGNRQNPAYAPKDKEE